MEARLCLATLLLLFGLGSVTSKEAYATLLYGDAFEAGVRVLGQSLRETRTKRDLVVLVTGNVSSSTVETLRSDGWRVRPVGTIQNPGRWTQTSRHKFPARFWAVYTKLLIFNLTEYERVVYLDADTVVMRNIDDMFLCDGLCGVMRHSERLNTGVMVLEPSEAMFKDMMERMATTPSYTGGDQGFLNSYFSDFAAAPFFDPGKGLKLSDTKPEWTSVTGIKLGRLPTVFNADTGLFVLNSNRWTLPESEIRVMHYTLAVFKPWDYWTSWIMRNVYIWQGLRARLPPNSLGLLYGETQRQYVSRLVLLPLPLLLAALLVRRYLWSAGLCGFMQCFCCRLRARLGLHSSTCSSSSSGRLAGNGSGAANGSGGAAGGGSPGAAGCLVAAQFQPLLFEGGGAPVSIPPFLPAAAIAAGLACAAAALGLSTRLIIPSQMRPMYGWVMAYEWTTLLFVVFYSQFLRACYVWGQRSVWRAEGFKDDTVKHTSGLRRPWAESLWLFTLIVVGLGLIPWWADIVPGVEAFGAKVVFTAVAGVVTALVCAQAFIELAASWHQCGKVEATHPWSSAAKQLAV